ncbi:hypothetical protein BCIN_12g01630 [Botrytis cinerea B05.10]|uniref:Uncharacterized protein n=1 Tax=Botryotinia fuckeliana (strain B05.10) TaxID=332648 RepID=A0A384JYC4_BOTFB|nr:hypothetical protein BCIN_12g01630 [Botrytis cinerea B05.10]ATZ55580.1 hypothetical protein BCIN_12g01630 [Botrytis cinerea B05.10]
MFSPVRSSARGRIRNSNPDENGLALLPSSFLPPSYSFEDLYRELVDGKQEGKDEELESLVILASCLKENSNISKKADDDIWHGKLEAYLSEKLLPDGKIFSLDKFDEEDQPDKVHKIKQCKEKYNLCILSIENLLSISPKTLQPPKNSTLLSLIPFTNTSYAWTTPQSQTTAITILDKYASYAKSPEFLVNNLLRSFIRLIFSEAATPESVTASSRKAFPSSAPPRHFDILESSPSKQPWRSNIPYTIPVLQWIVDIVPPDLLRAQAWPLLTTPILILLDSPSNSIRTHALRILPMLFSKMGDKLLQQTGLGDVFENTLHPVLLFLPSTTPVEETLKLLPETYKALSALCNAIWPSKGDEEASTGVTTITINKASKHNTTPSKSPAQLRLAFLDRIVRHAILPAYLHCQEIPSVVEILVVQIGIIIPEMKISGVKHLKDILPILVNILSNPFFPDTSPSLVINTLKTLREVILVFWPRISIDEHRLVIISALTLLNCHICSRVDEKSEEQERARSEILDHLLETGKVFTAVVQQAGDEKERQSFEQELTKIIETDETLARVFPK